MDIPPFYRTDVTIIKIMHSVWALTLQRDVKHWKDSTRKLWKVWKMCINMRYFRSIIQCRWGGTFVISVVVLRDIWREVLVFRKWQNSESKTRIKMSLEIWHILVCYRIKLSVKLFWNNAKLSIKKMEIFFKDTLQLKHKQQNPLIQYGGGTTTRLYSAIPFLKLDDSRKRPRCLLVYQQKKEQDPGISKRKDFFCVWVLTGNIWRTPGTFHCEHDVHAWLSSSATSANVVFQTTQQWLQRSPNLLELKMTMQNAMSRT